MHDDFTVGAKPDAIDRAISVLWSRRELPKGERLFGPEFEQKILGAVRGPDPLVFKQYRQWYQQEMYLDQWEGGEYAR